MSDNQFRSLPTVASLDSSVRKIAARLGSLEAEFSGETPDGQFARLWESVEELNLRVLFLMNIITVTINLSPIADARTGQVPKRKMKALEAYMTCGRGCPPDQCTHQSGRDQIIATLEAQAQAAAAEGGLQVEQYEDLQAEGQTGAAPADQDHRAATDADAQGTAEDSSGATTLVGNNSRTKH